MRAKRTTRILRCLWRINRLLRSDGYALTDFMKAVCDTLPSAMEYPDAVTVKVAIRRHEACSTAYRRPREAMNIPIRINRELIGELEVGYHDSKPEAEDGPFYRDERSLMEMVAVLLGSVARHAEADVLATQRQTELVQSNQAMQQVLKTYQQEREQIGRQVESQVRGVILPLLDQLHQRVEPKLREHVAAIRRQLTDLSEWNVTARPEHTLNGREGFTPMETRVCALIRDGRSTKEIAAMLGVSPFTVSRHRDHIRRKLGIAHRQVNLMTHLRNL